MTEFKFEDLSKKTVAELREIAKGVEHEALQNAAKMPKAELLAAVCQALGIEAGEAPQETASEQESAVPEDNEDTEETAAEAAPHSSPETSEKEQEPPAQESEAADASEGKVEEEVKEEEAVAPESEASEPPEESPKEEEAAAAQEEEATEPAAGDAEAEEPAAQEGAKKKEAAAEEAPAEESPPVVNKDKSKFKVQIRELKSQRDAALEAHDHVQLKAIRRRIRSLKRKVRRIAV